jgi:hypothetical protein
MLDFSHDSHGHVQRVEQIEDMRAAAWAALGMSDEDAVAVEIGRMKIGSADERVCLWELGFAAVNVNFWITPDDANLDEKSRGLVVYDVDAPPQ